MKLVIELDKDITESLNDGVGLTDCQYKSLVDAITNGKPLIESDKEGVEPHECNTCKFGKNYTNGYDATTMNDECGGCCSWNDKWQAKEGGAECRK